MRRLKLRKSTILNTLSVLLLGIATSYGQDALTAPKPTGGCGGEHEPACSWIEARLSRPSMKPVAGTISVNDLKAEQKKEEPKLPTIPLDYKDKFKTLVIQSSLAGNQARQAEEAFRQAQTRQQEVSNKILALQQEMFKKLNLCTDEKSCEYQVQLTPDGEVNIVKLPKTPADQKEEKK